MSEMRISSYDKAVVSDLAYRPEEDRKGGSYEENDDSEAETTRCELLRFATMDERGRGRLHVEERDVELWHPGEEEKEEVKVGVRSQTGSREGICENRAEQVEGKEGETRGVLPSLRSISAQNLVTHRCQVSFRYILLIWTCRYGFFSPRDDPSERKERVGRRQ